MNRVILLGRLVRDPEIKDLGGDSRLATYTRAVNREFRAQSGDAVDYIRCVCFGKPAQNAEKWLKKGQLVCVSGWLRSGRYKNKNGESVFTLDVQVDRAEFAESKRASEERQKLEESGEQLTNGVKEIESLDRSVDRREPVKNTPPIEDDFMRIPEGFDEDNVPFS